MREKITFGLGFPPKARIFKRRSFRLFALFLIFAVASFVSLKISELNINEKVDRLKEEIMTEEKRYGGEEKIKELREELRFLKEIESFWIASRTKNNLILNLFKRLSDVITKKVQVDEVYISANSSPYSVDFSIIGFAETLYDAERFSSRLNKKRVRKTKGDSDNFLIQSEIVSVQNEGGKTKFVIKGRIFRAGEK